MEETKTNRVYRHLSLGLMCLLSLGCSQTTVDCPAGEEYNFALAECKVPCPTGGLHCDGACVDVVSGTDHCGTCGNACATGGTCNAGRCVCPVGLIPCDGACVDLSSDPAHCGVCGDACLEGGRCSDGQCACLAGATVCRDSTPYEVQGVPLTVPLALRANLNEEWTLRAPPRATEMRLRFDRLSTLHSADWVTIFRGDEQLAQYSGEIGRLGEGSSELGGDDGRWTEWFSATELSIRFTSDNPTAVGGFTIDSAEARPLPPSEYCSDLTSDSANCGACRAACPGDSVCTAGECSCPDGGLVCEAPARR